MFSGSTVWDFSKSHQSLAEAEIPSTNCFLFVIQNPQLVLGIARQEARTATGLRPLRPAAWPGPIHFTAVFCLEIINFPSPQLF